MFFDWWQYAHYWLNYLFNLCRCCRCDSTRESSQGKSHCGSARQRLNSQPVCEQWGWIHVRTLTSLLSALPPSTTIHQFFTPVHVFFRAWKLTLLDTRRNPVSDPLFSGRAETWSAHSVWCFHLSAKMFLSVGVHIRPIWWLLSSYPHEQPPHCLHHTWGRTRYVTILTSTEQP